MIVLNDIILTYPNIYSPRNLPGFKPRYGAGFKYEGNGLAGKGIFSNSRDIYNATSAYPPLVSVKNGKYSLLVEALNIADARNLSRDKLLKDMTVDLALAIYEYDNPHGQGRGISIAQVEVDAELMLKLAQE